VLPTKNISVHSPSENKEYAFWKSGLYVGSIFSQFRVYNTSENITKLTSYTSLDGPCRCRKSEEEIQNQKPCHFSGTSGFSVH
jgi:hypothetical protein